MNIELVTIFCLHITFTSSSTIAEATWESRRSLQIITIYLRGITAHLKVSLQAITAHLQVITINLQGITAHLNWGLQAITVHLPVITISLQGVTVSYTKYPYI